MNSKSKIFSAIMGLLAFPLSCFGQQHISQIQSPILHKEIPVLNSTPCSKYLVEFGSDVETLTLKAKEVGLVFIDSIGYPRDSNHYILQYSADTVNQTVVIAFILNKSSNRYNGIICFIRSRDIPEAIIEFESAKEMISKNWGTLNPNKNYKVSKCVVDGVKRIINYNTSGKNNTLTISIFEEKKQ